MEKCILDKPGNLSKKEWQVIENHPIDGFHRYALQFDPSEALPILLHHTLQTNYYPTSAKMEKNASVYDMSLAELTDDEIMKKAAVIAIADNLEARFPILSVDNPSSHIRKYSGRQYTVEELPILVRASFTEAGKLRKLGLTPLLDTLLEYSNDTFLKKQKSLEPEEE